MKALLKRFIVKPQVLILIVLLMTQCRKDEDAIFNETSTLDGAVAIEYMELLRDFTKKTPGFSPPVASRAFGYAGLTLYESVVHGMPRYQSLTGLVNGLNDLPKPALGNEYHWGQVANAAMSVVTNLYYPTAPESLKNQVVLLEAQFKTKYLEDVSEAILNRSTEFGRDIANAIFEYSKSDGGHEGYKSNFPPYSVPIGVGFWVPTSAGNPTPLQPFWGNNRTFVKDLNIHSQPPKHSEFSTEKTSLFFSQVLEVYAVTNNLSQSQQDIAKYWSDDPGVPGTPPGHSISIGSQVLAKENADLAKAAETYAKIGIAVSDAFVSCWKCKFDYNLMRPVTYINQHIDPNWTTLLATPPFPEYTSGHSVQSGATARVLSDLFGYNYSFLDRTHEKRSDINGTPRAFRSFDQAAQEAAVSRLYGGIHFREAIDLGVLQGNKVGDEVGLIKFRK